MVRAKVDYKARTAGPGGASQRTDLTGNQPLRVPTGMPYGEAGKLRTMEQAISLPQAQMPPGPSTAPQRAPSGPTVQTGAPGTTAPAPRPENAPEGSFDDVLGLIGSHPTQYPGRPVGVRPTVAGTMSQMLTSLGDSPDVAAMANLARQMGI